MIDNELDQLLKDTWNRLKISPAIAAGLVSCTAQDAEKWLAGGDFPGDDKLHIRLASALALTVHQMYERQRRIRRKKTN